MGRWRNSPFCWRLSLACAANPPHFFGACPKKRGGAPKKSAWGGGAPERFRDPPASPTRVGGATRPLRCPLRGRIGSLAPGARGLGWRKSSQVKVFCPAFLQKSGRGPGAAPLAARRSARNSLVLKKRRRGSKGEPSPGVPPFAPAYAGAVSFPLLRNKKRGTRYRVPRLALAKTHTTPSAIMAAATFRKPATFAPTMRSPVLPTSTEAS